MLGCDVHNSGLGRDDVWNYPVYELTKAEYKEAPDQPSERVVEVVCEVKCWRGGAYSLYYWYNVTYDENGWSHQSQATDWKDHPSAPDNEKRPDTVWIPDRKTAVSPYWQGQLDYSQIRAIVPVPQEGD